MSTVTVACKIPNGLQLDLEGHKSVILKGPSVAWGAPPIAIGGYALTPNVDADFMAAWLTVYKDSDMVKKMFVFAYPKHADASSAALEFQDEKTGLEPLDPDKPGPGLEREPGLSRGRVGA